MAAHPPSLALLFPGQGVGDADSRDLVAERRPDLLELACELVGDDPFARIDDGTRFAQPVVYCAALAGLERLGRPPAQLYAGHSLGEISALAAAGAVDDLDGLRIVVARGRLMDEAASAGPPGGMLAVGGDRDQAEALAQGAGLEIANENSASQFVLTGTLAGIDAALRSARDLGLRAKRLAVAGAFHSGSIAPAIEPFRERLAEIDFRPSRAPVVSCVTAAPFGPDPRDLLAAALTSPVRWVEVMHRLRAEGAERFCDVGPGKVLAGLVRRTLEGAEVIVGAAAPEPAHA
jgi:malonyl CoA-acyl carrier protein transacylase